MTVARTAQCRRKPDYPPQFHRIRVHAWRIASCALALLLGAEAAQAQRVDLEGVGTACSDGCPHSPTGYAEPGPGGGEITVHWTPATTGPAALTWRVYSETPGGTLISYGPFAAATTSYTIRDLKQGVQYEVAVRGLGQDDVLGRAAVARNVSPLDTAPTLQGAAISGPTLTVTFDEALAEDSVPAVGAFQVLVDGGGTVLEGAASITGATATLTLRNDRPVTHGQAVRVWYVPANAGTPLQDRTGNAVPGFDDRPVTNNTPPVFSSAAVNRAALTITFDGGLATDAGSVPAAGDFEVTVDGTAVDLAETNPVAVAGSAVTLTLAVEVLHGETVAVSATR